MSLTRKEWSEMYESIKKMESLITTPVNRQPTGVHRMNLMMIEVNKMKKQVESVLSMLSVG